MTMKGIDKNIITFFTARINYDCGKTGLSPNVTPTQIFPTNIRDL